MSVTLKLLESEAEITRKVNAAIAPSINIYLDKRLPAIISGARQLVTSWVTSSSAMESLAQASPESLAGAFGVHPSSAIDIVNVIAESVAVSTTVELQKFDKNLKGSLSLSIQPDDFVNLLALPQGHTIYDGGDLHWLQWLLTLGNAPIVRNYHYEAGSGRGRTGLGVMAAGGSFRVPPQYSGTIDDNFITRALSGTDQENQIANMIERILR